MARKILGIDIGDSSIKFVQVEKPLRGNATIRAIEKKNPISENGNKPEISLLIKESLEEYQLFSDDYTVSIPSGKTLVREVNLPFRERSKIEKIIKFNIEQNIPFQPDEIIADFEIKKSSSGKNNVVAYIVKKNDIKKYLEIFESAGIEPKVITFSPYCIGKILKNKDISDDEVFAILHIESHSASVTVYNEGVPCFFRKFESALNSSIEKIAQSKNISFDDAQKLFLSSESAESSESEEVGKIVEQLAEKISSDVLVSLASYESKHSDQKISRIFVSGEGASVMMLKEKIREFTAIPAELVDCLPAFEYSSPDDNPKKPLFNNAIASALVELPFSRRKLNFRKEEFSYEWIDEKFKKRIKNVLILSAVIFVLFCVNSAFSLFQHKSKNTEIEKKVETLYRSMVPQGKVVNAIVQARQRLDEVKEKSDSFKDVSDKGISSLEVLNALSVNIEKDWTITLEGLEMQGKRIDLKGRGRSVDEFEKYKKNLLESEIFESAEIRKIDKDNSGKLSSFKMELKLNK